MYISCPYRKSFSIENKPPRLKKNLPRNFPSMCWTFPTRTRVVCLSVLFLFRYCLQYGAARSYANHNLKSVLRIRLHYLTLSENNAVFLYSKEIVLFTIEWNNNQRWKYISAFEIVFINERDFFIWWFSRYLRICE